jgi:hypothetical protein
VDEADGVDPVDEMDEAELSMLSMPLPIPPRKPAGRICFDTAGRRG